ncbi:GntR family transcriptional regulator [Paenibacillus koleovorans]|uniref:GntR family transcriptional regulator n=1 Tax=Paenibacillus koleovorans TaxID=121608 RepID=UPI000FD72088|nr:GntR family transcriptional regulator [Paenibacillus koleovorans]
MSEEQDIMDHLIAAIQAGQYEPEDKLLSENDLAEQFRVPRITARKAYERLQEMGYIYSKQGRGSFVKDRHQRIPLLLSASESFSKKMLELGYDYQSRNVFCEPIEYNRKIFKALGVEETDRVFKIGRLRMVSRQPIALHISYVAEVLFQDIEQVGRDITSMYEFYKSRGFTELGGPAQTLLSISFPTKYERSLLACSSLIPLLVLESACEDLRTGKTLEFTRTLYRGDYFTYEV